MRFTVCSVHTRKKTLVRFTRFIAAAFRRLLTLASSPDAGLDAADVSCVNRQCASCESAAGRRG